VQHLEKHLPDTPRYAGIVLDEIQDLSPAAIRVLVALQAGNTDDVLLLGDAAQCVYRSGFRWQHLGMRIAGGQVAILRRSFRSTAPIVRAATPLVTSQVVDLEDDLVLPTVDEGQEAPPVKLTLYETIDDELDEVASAIALLIQKGVPPSSIGVLLDDTKTRKLMAGRLTERECPIEELYKPSGVKSIDVFSQSVKLLTTWSAKGLEFQVLFLPCISEARFTSSVANREEADSARRGLYTAFLRCAWDLRLSAVRGQESGLLAEIDLPEERVAAAL